MKSRYTLAIDNQHIALIKRERNQFFIELLRTLEPHVKPLDILKPILNRKSAQTVSGLEAQEVILRRLKLKLKSRREILAALPFQMEEHIPFPAEEVVAVPTIQPGKGESTVDLMATRQETLDHHNEELQKRGVDPDVISADPIALFRFAEFLYPQQGSLLIYDPKKRILAAMRDHALVAFQVVQDGEFDRSLEFFRKKFPAIEQILTIGPPPEGIPLQCLKVENEEWIPYATAIGLALDAAKADGQSRQFLSGSHRSKREVKKEKRSALTFFALCGLFCISIITLSHRYFEKDTATFLHQLDLTKNTSLRQVAASLKKSAKKGEKAPLATLNIPAVHEVLTWLSNHPSLQEEITINHLKYQITKCPRLGTQIRTFEGKVEIEFITELPRVARAFHESLESDTRFVDRRHNVQFSADHGLYKMSFYLKRRSK